MRMKLTPLPLDGKSNGPCGRPRLTRPGVGGIRDEVGFRIGVSLARWRRVTQLLLVMAVWLSQVTIAGAVNIDDHKWGFNGKVAPHRFNVLSVLVNNPTPQPFTGDLKLTKSMGAGTVDAPLVENVTLSPHTSKWIQFYPYIASENSYSGAINENWHLSYPGGGMDLAVPRLAKYQRVILDDPNSVTARGGVVKFHLPDNLFPPFVTATDALQLVVLDHVPRWEESRRQAFLDWLYLGGTVVVLHDASGKFPEFKDALTILKSPLDEQPHGSGRIVRLPMNRSQFTEEEYRQTCLGLPKNYYNPQATEKTDDIIDRIDESQAINAAQNYNGYSEGSDPFKANSFLGQLKQMTKPEHNWLLLHFMFWVYIALIFPGCYLLGKKWSDFRVVYAGLLGVVTLFSIAFSYVGARGYGESTAVHTVAIGKPLPDGQMDVSAWSNIFVTSGADYFVRHNAWGALYSTCNEVEAVRGRINNGAEAVFAVDIPPYSNREFATRAKIPFAGPKLTVESVKLQDDRLASAEIEVQEMQEKDCLKAMALVGNSFYQLNWRDGKLVLANEIGSVVGTLRVQEHHNRYGYGYPYGYGYDDGNQTSLTERYTQMYDLLLSRGLNVGREKEAEMIVVPKNMIRVFLYSKLPGEFAVQEKNNRLTNQTGRMMYCITLPLPTESTP